MKTTRNFLHTILLAGFMLPGIVTVYGQSSAAKATDNYALNIGPIVSAGPDASMCDNDVFVTQGVSNGNDGLTIWKTSGDGTFNNVYNLNSFYTPGSGDKRNGTVTLTITYISDDGMIHDDMSLFFLNCHGAFEIDEM